MLMRITVRIEGVEVHLTERQFASLRKILQCAGHDLVVERRVTEVSVVPARIHHEAA